MTAESGVATQTPVPVATTPVLHFVMGSNAGMAGGTSDTELVRNIDLYTLDTLDLSAVSGLLVNGNCDQIYLERNKEVLTNFVTAGGRVAVMGHPLTDFLPGLGQWRKLQYSGPKDLAISAGSPHPVWAGVDPADLSFRKEVSGFYGRGYSQKLPDNASVTNYIGRHRLPVDYVYPLGKGEVLVHGGIDLAVFQADPNTSAHVYPQLLSWLAQLDRTDIR